MKNTEQDLNYGVHIDTKAQAKAEYPPLDSHRNLNTEKQPVAEGGNYKLSNASHPIACIFTFIFKLAAFLVYFLVGNFLSDVSTFIIVVILSALDFWTVKNVTGRLLVGLRWWSDFDETGKEIWRFQSYDQEFKSNPVDASFFWMSQLAAVVTWAVFLVLKVLSFSVFWSLLTFINLILAFTNLWGYNKCRGEHNKKIADLKSEIGKQGLKTVMNQFINGK